MKILDKILDELLDEIIGSDINFRHPDEDTQGEAWCKCCYGILDKKKLGIEAHSFLNLDHLNINIMDNVVKFFYITTLFCMCDGATELRIVYLNSELVIETYIENKWYEMIPPPRFIAKPIFWFIIEFLNLDLFCEIKNPNLFLIKFKEKQFYSKLILTNVTNESYSILIKFGNPK